MLHVHLRCVRFSVTAARELLARGGWTRAGRPGGIEHRRVWPVGVGLRGPRGEYQGEAQSSEGGILPFNGESDEGGDAVSPLWDLRRRRRGRTTTRRRRAASASGGTAGPSCGAWATRARGTGA